MNIWDIVVGLLVLLILYFALRLARDRKKNGGCCGAGCSSDCASCSGCTHHPKK